MMIVIVVGRHTWNSFQRPGKGELEIRGRIKIIRTAALLGLDSVNEFDREETL